MPTDKPRVTFTISQERLSEVEAYRFDNKIKNQTQAILSLIEKGLSSISKEENSPETEKSVPVENLQKINVLSSAFEQLNEEGQNKLVDYAEDLVASGRYIKSDTNRLGDEKYA